MALLMQLQLSVSVCVPIIRLQMPAVLLVVASSCLPSCAEPSPQDCHEALGQVVHPVVGNNHHRSDHEVSGRQPDAGCTVGVTRGTSETHVLGFWQLHRPQKKRRRRRKIITCAHKQRKTQYSSGTQDSIAAQQRSTACVSAAGLACCGFGIRQQGCHSARKQPSPAHAYHSSQPTLTMTGCCGMRAREGSTGGCCCGCGCCCCGWAAGPLCSLTSCSIVDGSVVCSAVSCSCMRCMDLSISFRSAPSPAAAEEAFWLWTWAWYTRPPAPVSCW